MKWSLSPLSPWAQRAYETCLSTGSTAVLAHGHKTGAPTRSCTELASIPKKCIAKNALRALKLASLTGFAPAYALRASAGQAGGLLHERQACCLDYTTGTEMVRLDSRLPPGEATGPLTSAS